jgi:hypothetical protein
MSRTANHMLLLAGATFALTCSAQPDGSESAHEQRLLVANKGDNTLSVVDPATLTS